MSMSDVYAKLEGVVTIETNPGPEARMYIDVGSDKETVISQLMNKELLITFESFRSDGTALYRMSMGKR